jgi:hypothetical protein
VGHPNIKYSSARNIYRPTFLKTFVLQATAYELNADAPSTVSNIKSILAHSLSSTVGKVDRIAALIGAIGYKDIGCNFNRNSTTADFISTESYLREPERPHAKSIVESNSKAGFITLCLRSGDRRSSRRIAKNPSTHCLRYYKHCHVCTTSPWTRTTPRTNGHHHSRPGRSGYHACE